jgi:hypothetical protein
MRPFTAALALTGLLTSSPAWACGGFFCNQRPIDQAKESIVFAVDPVAGTIETHVQISYEGDAEEFAWVVPVPGVPTLFPSSELLFTALAGATSPLKLRNFREEGTCNTAQDTWWWDADTAAVDSDFAETDDSASILDTASPPPVLVLQEQRVGPYDTVVLSATSDAELLDWLVDHNYDVPPTLGPAIAPYLAGGMNLLALRLANDTDAGDIVPLGMEYVASQPMIPIILTRIAAVEDMRIDVWILGPDRAVPVNYLHTTINDPILDWYNSGSDYQQRAKQAVAEAGPHVFFTDVSEPASNYAGSVLRAPIDTTPLRTIVDPVAYVGAVQNLGLTGTQTLLDILSHHIAVPPALAAQGVTSRDLFNCMWCYRSYLTTPIDAEALTDELEAGLVQPMRNAEQLFVDHPHLTRLSTYLSPADMTVDPMFAFNADLPDVPRRTQVEFVRECDPLLYSDEVPLRVALPDGRTLRLPPEIVMSALRATDQAWEVTAYRHYIDTLQLPAAGVVMQFSESGLGQVVLDNTVLPLPEPAETVVDTDVDTEVPVVDTDASDTFLDVLDTELDSEPVVDSDDSEVLADSDDSEVLADSDDSEVLADSDDSEVLADSDDSEIVTDSEVSADTDDSEVFADTDDSEAVTDSETPEPPDGCGGCSGTARSPAAAWLLLPLIALARRRYSSRRSASSRCPSDG